MFNGVEYKYYENAGDVDEPCPFLTPDGTRGWIKTPKQGSIWYDFSGLKNVCMDGNMILGCLRYGVILEHYDEKWYQFKCMICPGNKKASSGHMTVHRVKSVQDCTSTYCGFRCFPQDYELHYYDMLTTAVTNEMVEKFNSNTKEAKRGEAQSSGAQANEGIIQMLQQHVANLTEKVRALEEQLTAVTANLREVESAIR